MGEGASHEEPRGKREGRGALTCTLPPHTHAHLPNPPKPRQFCDNLHGGLNKLAELLDVQRIGPQHQAGSDSLLTSLTFLKLAKRFFAGVDGVKPHVGKLYGLGVDGENGYAKQQFD